MNPPKHLQIAQKIGLLEFLQDEMPGAAQWEKLSPMLEAYGSLAYEAGRKDENEACIDIVAWHGGSVEIEAAIRARMQP